MVFKTPCGGGRWFTVFANNALLCRLFLSLVFFLIAATAHLHTFLFYNRPVDEGSVHAQAVLSAGGRPPPREDTKVGGAEHLVAYTRSG